LGITATYMTVDSSCSSRRAIATPPLRPSSDIVSAPSRSSIQPPTQLPSRSRFSPLVGGETRHSSGWIIEQW
jgi:hypothetical protein